jgi:hypothetical protein
MTDPAISWADAADICAHAWPSEATARAQAAILDDAGWTVEHRWPPVESGRTGRLAVASVYHPVTYESPGEVTYRGGADTSGIQPGGAPLDSAG